MWELTKRMSWRISPVLSKVEPETGTGAGPLHQLRLRPKSTGSDRFRLRNTATLLAVHSLSTFLFRSLNKFFHIFLSFSH